MCSEMVLVFEIYLEKVINLGKWIVSPVIETHD